MLLWTQNLAVIGVGGALLIPRVAWGGALEAY
jgi:hypothetical protein